MELWDAYNADHEKIEGAVLVRGEDDTFPDGMYHLVCEVLVRHVDGTLRELREETGIVADKLEFLDKSLGKHCWHVRFLCVTDCDKNSVKLQEGETCDFKWVTAAEALSMTENDLINEPMRKFIK